MDQENIVDMILDSDESDTGNTPVENYAEEKPYTKQDEQQARAEQMKQLRQELIQKELAKSKAQKAVSTNDRISKLEMELIKKETILNELNKKLTGIQSNVENQQDSLTAEDIQKQERQLANDPVVSNYYDVNKVREGYISRAKNEGRFFTPEEEWAIQNARKLASENMELKNKMNFKRELMEGGLGRGDNPNMPTDDGFADVQDEKAAYEWSLRKAKNLF